MVLNHLHPSQQPLLSLLILTAGLTLNLPNPRLTADENLRQATRTAMIRNATGDTPSNAANPGYATYIESVLDLNTDPAQNYTNREFEPVAAPAPALDPYLANVEKETTAQLNDKSRLDTRENLMSSLQKPLDTQMRSNEDAYQYERGRAERLYEEAQRREQTAAPDLQQTAGSREQNVSSEGLRPSLANNPFYFSPTPETDYAETKILMTSRLVQLGYTQLEAANILESTSSPEDAVLALMQKEGFSYGDAANIAGTSQGTAAPASMNNNPPE